MLNLPITEGELTFLAKFVNCASILLFGRIAHTVWTCNILAVPVADNATSGTGSLRQG